MKNIIQEAKEKLSNAGYEHICSVMHNSNNKNYGLQYSKNGVTFWLNQETVHQLPYDVR